MCECKEAGSLAGGKWDKMFEQSRRVYDSDGLSPTLHTMGGGGQEINFVEPLQIKEATKKGYTEAFAGDSVNLEQPKSKTRRGRVGNQVAQAMTTSCNQGVVVSDDTKVIDFYNKTEKKDGCVGTITTKNGRTQCGVFGVQNRIRKLTPRECFRLMGVRDGDFDDIAKNQSDSSLYHLAGDSIVVDVLMAIFREML